jgi:hypothetical protein
LSDNPIDPTDEYFAQLNFGDFRSEADRQEKLERYRKARDAKCERDNQVAMAALRNAK